jgi:hypothetical protein
VPASTTRQIAQSARPAAPRETERVARPVSRDAIGFSSRPACAVASAGGQQLHETRHRHSLGEVAADEEGALKLTSVYRSIDAAGDADYVGQTTNMVRRAATHLRKKGIVIDEIPGLSGLAPADGRAVEQILIEYHGLGKNRGTLLNKINSIAQTNPAYAGALKRGAALLRGAEYPEF